MLNINSFCDMLGISYAKGREILDSGLIPNLTVESFEGKDLKIPLTKIHPEFVRFFMARASVIMGKEEGEIHKKDIFQLLDDKEAHDKLYGKKCRRKTIFFGNVKGGVGKTAISITAAHIFGVLKNRVLFVDMDPQANATSFFSGGKEDFLLNIQHLFQSLLDKKKLSKKEVREHIQTARFQNCSIDYLPSDIPFDRTLELTRGYLDNPHKTLAKIIGEVEEDYDVILIDTPPRTGMPAQLAIWASDEVAIINEAEEMSLKGFKALVAVMDEMQSEFDKKLEGRYAFINNYLKNEQVQKEFKDIFVEQASQHKLNDLYLIPKNTNVQKSYVLRIPLLEYKEELQRYNNSMDGLIEYCVEKSLELF